VRRSLLPSLAALQAFESAARHGSFTRAAAEMNLTQGAISQQIRNLEATLGVRLFQRVGRRVVVTDLGRLYLLEVGQMVKSLHEATQRIMTVGAASNVLNIATLPTFGTRWLIPRLPDFYAQHPGVVINFATKPSRFSFAEEPFDAAIYYGSPAWVGAIMTKLFSEVVVVVCSPRFRKSNKIASPADLDNVVLLHQTTRPTGWSDWFAACGVTTDNGFRGPRFDQLSMVAQAAAVDLGAALLPRLFIEEEVKSGRLEILFESLPSENAYYLVIPETKAGLPLVVKFRDWMIRRAKEIR
jgi:LysR family glycine cleavage system transcriptional activator